MVRQHLYSLQKKGTEEAYAQKLEHANIGKQSDDAYLEKKSLRCELKNGKRRGEATGLSATFQKQG